MIWVWPMPPALLRLPWGMGRITRRDCWLAGRWRSVIACANSMNGCSRMDNEQGDNMNRPHDQSKEWKLIEKVVMEMQGEQKRSRRWGIFFKLLTFTYLIGILMLLRVPGE